MNEKKNILLYVVIGVAVGMIVAVSILLIKFLNKSDNAPVDGVTPIAEEVDGVPVEPVEVLPGFDKDSILKSTDRGQTFEEYFRVATATDPGIIDALGIAFHPTVPDQIIVSTFEDGLYFNENKKNTWKPILFPPQKIYSFILDNKDPDNRSFASGVVSGNGRIFRTEDGGASWRAVYAEPGNNTFVSAITQDPRNNELILAGTSGGTLARSTDGGDTWKNIGQKIIAKITYFTHDSTKASFVYLLVTGGKIYHSYDAGVTWLNWEEEKTKEIKALNDKAAAASRARDKAGSDSFRSQAAAITLQNRTEKTPAGIIFITADPNTSGTLYASLSKGLYRSTDYGKYWKPVNIIESAEKFPITSIAINPDDSNEISFVAGNTFYRSVNYGVTWAITPIDKTRTASFVAYDPLDPSVIFVGVSAKK